MTPIRGRATPRQVALAVIVAAVALAILLALAGFDVPAMAIGAAIVAASFAVISTTLRRPLARADRASRRRDREHERADRKRHAHTRQVIRKNERRLFSQMEALLWLRDSLALDGPLPPLSSTTASPELLRELVMVIDRTRPHTVLEVGSGVSTIVMAARLRAHGGGRLVALEHSPLYADITRQQLSAHGLADVATVVEAPLGEVLIGERAWSWYQLPETGIPSEVELLLVDGPPANTGPLARYPALPVLADRLAAGATVIVDDADRPDEKEIVERWQAEIDGLEATYRRLAKGAYLLRMPA